MLLEGTMFHHHQCINCMSTIYLNKWSNKILYYKHVFLSFFRDIWIQFSLYQFPWYNNPFVLDHHNIIMRLDYKTLCFFIILNLACIGVSVSMDYFDQKIDKISIHLILFITIFTIGFLLSIRGYNNDISYLYHND